jgi:toxin ParE1/3/4
MAADLIWHPPARRDLLEIYETLGRDSPTTAERLYDRIDAKSRLLVDYPRLGPRRSDIRSAARMLVVGRHIPQYETDPDTTNGRIQTVSIVA